jgi:hypothetical protein
MKILTQLIEQYQAKHNRLPVEIILHPLTLPVLAKRRCLSPTWKGIPIICRELEIPAKVENPTRLGIVIHDGYLRCFDF